MPGAITVVDFNVGEEMPAGAVFSVGCDDIVVPVGAGAVVADAELSGAPTAMSQRWPGSP